MYREHEQRRLVRLNNVRMWVSVGSPRMQMCLLCIREAPEGERIKYGPDEEIYESLRGSLRGRRGIIDLSGTHCDRDEREDGQVERWV